MKKIFAFLGVLIVADLGATYYVSGLVEKQFLDMERFLSENQFVSYEVISYKRGFFKSEAVTSLNKVVKMKHTIYNGPIIIGASKGKPVEFQLGVIQSESLNAQDPINLPFTSKTVFNYSGAIESLTEGSAFNIKKEQIQISGGPWTSESHISKDWQEFKGEMSVPDMMIQPVGFPMGLTVKNVKILCDQKRSLFGNWLGDVSFSLGSASQKDQGLEISNVQLEEQSKLRDQVVDFVWKAELGKAVYANENYGPLHFKMQAKSIDPEAIKSISDKSILLDKDKKDKMIQQFLLKRPQFIIEHSEMTVPHGIIQIDADLAVGGGDIALPLNRDVIIKTANGNFLLMMPQEIFRKSLRLGLQKQVAMDPEYKKMDDIQKQEALDQQVNIKIQKLTQDGILTEKETNYVIQFSIVQGKWLVNGKEVQSDIQSPASVKPVQPENLQKPNNETKIHKKSRPKHPK